MVLSACLAYLDALAGNPSGNGKGIIRAAVGTTAAKMVEYAKGLSGAVFPHLVAWGLKWRGRRSPQGRYGRQPAWFLLHGPRYIIAHDFV